MTISSLLFGVGLIALSAYFIWLPFRQQAEGAGGGVEGSERQKLLGLKAAIYAAIREIDADVQVGKLEAADHKVLRRQYVTEGVAVLKSLAELNERDPAEAAIEADVARLKAGEELRVDAAAVAQAGVFCTACGAPAAQGDRFCARCGSQLRG